MKYFQFWSSDVSSALNYGQFWDKDVASAMNDLRLEAVENCFVIKSVKKMFLVIKPARKKFGRNKCLIIVKG